VIWLFDVFRKVLQEEGLIQLLKADETLNLMEEILCELEKKHGVDWYLYYIIFGRFKDAERRGGTHIKV